MVNTRRTQVRPRGQGYSWLALAGYAALGLACLMLALATFILVAAPLDGVRDRLAEDIKARTGRDFAVSGGTSLNLLPRLAVSFADVSLSAPPGMGGEPILRAKSLEAEVGFLSLLSQRPAIRRLVLSRPVIELRVDAQGRRNWDFAALEVRRVRLAQAAPGPSGTRSQVRQGWPAGGAQLAPALEKLLPTSVRLIDGTVRYADERVGVRHELGSLGLDLVANDIAGPLEAKGTFAWRGETLAFEGALSTIRAMLEEQKARLTIKLSGRPIEASYDGALDVATGLALDGLVDVKAPSLHGLASWAGGQMDAGQQDAGALSLSSSLAAADGRVSLSRLTATLGATSLDGALTIETKGVRPHVSGNLQLSELDLARMLIRSGPPVASQPAARPQADPIDDILRRTDTPAKAPQQGRELPKRAGAGSGWSDERLDFSSLALADANLALSVARLVHRDVKTGPSRLSLKLEDRVADLALEEMQLYGGRGRGILRLDGSGGVPAASANLILDGVSAQPLLKDALGFDWLEGRSTISLALAGQGTSERQIVETLNGKVDMATVNGAINGIDVGKLLRSIERGRFGELAASAGDKTAFSEFAGTFAIANGVAHNQDLRLVSNSLRASGSGSVNLAARSLDYTVIPKFQASASGERVAINLGNIEVPVRIEGPWDKPNVSVKGQEQIIEAVKEIGKNIKSKDVEEALKGLFGSGDGQRVKPRDLLEKFLKKQ
jgi:AsmA protein